MTLPINPYDSFEKSAFWSKTISRKPLGSIQITNEFDSFKISQNDKIMSLGSCFAQHISNYLQSFSYRYLLYESGYNQFSAKYGNVYTVDQGLQLLNRAINLDLSGEVWTHYKNKYFVDSFRPRVFPYGFSTENEVISERSNHLVQTIKAFKDCDVLIYTLGLTEGWKAKATGQIFQIAPGVDGGSFDPDAHEPFDANLKQVVDNLQEFVTNLKSINSSVKVIFTVSPVHLAATHQNRNVVQASFESKMKLRLAVSEIQKNNEDIYYFPSLEYIFALGQSGKLYENDRRDVHELGVGLVMKMFTKSYLNESSNLVEKSYSRQDNLNREVICDEDVLLRE
jgi:hypothetical protein